MSSDFPAFALTEEHEALRESVRQLADDKIAPYAAEVDEQARFPQEALDALVKADLQAVHIPEAYGGAGADAIATVIVIEEVARACASSSLIPAVNKLGTVPLLLAASEEVKQRYLAPVARGEAMFSYALSEPEAGCDAAAMRTRAVARRRLLCPERHQALDHQRRGVDVLHGDGRDRPAGRSPRDLRVRRGEGRSGLQLRRPGAQARHQGLADQGAVLRQHPDSGRPDDRRGRYRIQDSARHPGPHPDHDRGPGARYRPGRAGLRGRLRQASASSSARRSPSSRASSSCWPTWP